MRTIARISRATEEAKQAEQMFDVVLQRAPVATRDALVWVRDTLAQCRRMLEAEGLEPTAQDLIELLRLLHVRESEERFIRENEVKVSE